MDMNESNPNPGGMGMFDEPPVRDVHRLELPPEFVEMRRREQQVRNWVKVILICTAVLFVLLVTW
jgi:hypothetical protein